MNIIETLDKVVADQLQEQKLRRESIKFKQDEIVKYQKFIDSNKERISKIEKEIEEVSLQIAEIVKIKKQLKEKSCVGV
jgi:hypothetical protein